MGSGAIIGMAARFVSCGWFSVLCGKSVGGTRQWIDYGAVSRARKRLQAGFEVESKLKQGFRELAERVL